MMEIIKAFGDIIITLPVSRVIIGQNAGFLVSPSFSEYFYTSYGRYSKSFFQVRCGQWYKRLDDNPASDIVMPLNLLRLIAGRMKPSKRVTNFRWYNVKK